MHRATTQHTSPESGTVSIRAIRQKLEASRSRTKAPLVPLALQHSELQHSFQAQVQEQREICDRAVQQLREGASIVIDWTTRSNFRVRTELPKLKTQPIELAMKRGNQSLSIETKRIELAKLLHERHKKFYMKSKEQQAQEVKLFGVDHKQSLRNSHIKKTQKRLALSKERRLSQVKHTIESAQHQILQKCKLTQLKEELKLKFRQIRDLYNSPKNNRMRCGVPNI